MARYRTRTIEFKRQLVRLFLSADIGTKNFKCREPTFVLATEAIKERVPFLTWYFLCLHNYLSSFARQTGDAPARATVPFLKVSVTIRAWPQRGQMFIERVGS